MGGRELVVKGFYELSLDELYDILKLRTDVFLVEQRVACSEVDGFDRHCLHVFLREGRDIVAYLRAFEKPGEPGVAQIGRVVAAKRGEGLGRAVMEAGMAACAERLEAHEAYVEAQLQARGFYDRLGFVPCSDEFDEGGVPHVAMRASLV
jgi:ElaA protein